MRTGSTIASRTTATSAITTALMENGTGLMASVAPRVSMSAWAISSPVGRVWWNERGAAR